MREKVLIFGSNFPLATRIADLVRREFEVILYEFSATSESGRTEVSTAFTGELLSDAIALHGPKYVVFTFESLLHIHSPIVLSGLLNEFITCKRQSPKTYIACVDIAEPIVAGPGRYIRVLQAENTYRERITLVRRALASLVDSVLQVQSVYTPEDDFWSPNFLHLLFEAKDDQPVEVCESVGDWEAIPADEVAQALISRLGHVGTTRLTRGAYPGGLRAFCAAAALEYRRCFLSHTLPLHTAADHDLATANLKQLPIHVDLHAVARQTNCSLNYIYRKAPEAAFGFRSVASLREELGSALARSIPHEVADAMDVIVPVPETGKMYAKGLAKTLELPYVEAIRKADRKRSFDIESFDSRRAFLHSRLSVVPGLLAGKSLIVVDEAIFTGVTLKLVSRLLRDEGAKCIYFAIPSPEARFGCKFNMQPKRALLSEYVRKEELWSYFNVQGVFFQDEEVFIRTIEQYGPKCMACFIQRGSNE